MPRHENQLPGIYNATALSLPDGAGAAPALNSRGELVTGAATTANTTTMQSAAVATGNGTAQTVTGYAEATIQIVGITTATITFEGYSDAVPTWVAIDAKKIGSSNVGTTATSDGIYRVKVSGLTQIRARISSYTSGTITVTSNLSTVSFTDKNQAVTQSTCLNPINGGDKVGTREEKYSYTNLSASALVRTGAGQIAGYYVASTSSGTVKFWDNTSAATTVLVNTATPAVGWHELHDMGFTTGLYCTIANTIDLTIAWKDNTVA